MKKIGEGIGLNDITEATTDELFVLLDDLISKHNIKDPDKDFTVLYQQIRIELKLRIANIRKHSEYSEDKLREVLLTALIEGGRESGIEITLPQAMDVLADTEVMRTLAGEYIIGGRNDTVFEEKVRWALVHTLTGGACEWPCYGDSPETKANFKLLVIDGARKRGWKLADGFEKGFN